jgi:hypothetical protein
MFNLEINWAEILTHLYHLAIAYMLALPIGWDRETSKKRFGLRTFPLVAVAACGFMFTGIYVLDTTEAEGRVIQGIITGMGFIGGGAILKGDTTVKGTATAASRGQYLEYRRHWHGSSFWQIRDSDYFEPAEFHYAARGGRGKREG